MAQESYDCNACVGYCCAYPIIPATRSDIRRLAKHLGLTEDDVRHEYTEQTENSNRRQLKQSKDALFKGKSCVFLDKDSRMCTVYKGRPEICRDHPGERCEWHDRMLIERSIAKGKKVVLLTEMPWTIDSEHPLYDNDRVTELLQSYATAKKGKEA